MSHKYKWTTTKPMENKQTAVEWLEEKLKENLKHIVINNDYVLMESIFLQAKEIEKEQIIDLTLYFGMNYNVDKPLKELYDQYINETYGDNL